LAKGGSDGDAIIWPLAKGMAKNSSPSPSPSPKRTCLNAGAREESQTDQPANSTQVQASEHSLTSEQQPTDPKPSSSPQEDPNIIAPLPALPNALTSTQVKPDSERPSLDEVLAFAATIGLAPWKAADFHQEMEAAGWLDYRHRPIVSWRPALARVKTKWEADSRPSSPSSNRQPGNQSQVHDAPNSHQAPIGEAQRLFLAKDELTRVEASIKSIRGSYDDHQSMSIKDHTRLKELKVRKAELTQILGYRAS
jgi:hypothetical protein